MNCSNGLKIFLLILGWILLITSISVTILMDSFFFDINPFNKHDLSKVNRTSFIQLLVLKLFLPLNNQIINLSIANTWIVLIFFLFIDAQNYIYPHCRYHRIQKFQDLLQTLACWIALTCCINLIFDSNNPDYYTAYYIYIGFPVWLLIRDNISRNRIYHIISNRNIFLETSSYNIKVYIQVLSEIVAYRDLEESTLERTYLVRSLQHRDISKHNLQNEIDILTLNIDNSKAWEMVYVKILKIFKKKLQKDSSIILFLQAYFFLYVQPKKYLAIAIIQDLMNYRLTTKEEFILINLKILSEVRIRSELTKQDILLNEFVQYESLKTSFSQKVLMMSKYKVKFWQNLSSDQPNFRNLDRASSEMNKLKVNIKDLFISLDKIKSMSMESLQKYAVYLQEVECNYIEAAKIFEKLSYMLKKKEARGLFQLQKVTILQL